MSGLEAVSRTFTMSLVVLLLLPLSGNYNEPSPTGEIVATLPDFDLYTKAFIENAGQLQESEIHYYATGSSASIGFAVGAVHMVFKEPPTDDKRTPFHESLDDSPSRGVALRLTFEGANFVVPEGRGQLPYPSHFFLGNDSARWRTNVRSFSEVIYRDLWGGIDLVYHLSDNGPKYEFTVKEGANLEDIHIRYEGVENIHIDASGDLVITTSLGEVRDTTPEATHDGQPIQCAFTLRQTRNVGFSCALSEVRGILTIDPVIYATFLGDNDGDSGRSLAVDATGSVVIVGSTRSPGFPVTPGAFDMLHNGGTDAYVAKLSPDGSTLLFATFLGGSQSDGGRSVDIDDMANIYLTGFTISPNFPATPGAFDTTCGTDGLCNYDGATYIPDAFIAELDFTGSTLLYSTYLGGSNEDSTRSIAVAGSGDVCVAGDTWSADFTTTPGAFDTTFNGSQDGFIVRLNGMGSDLVYASFLGGTADEIIISIALDATGNPYVSGWTTSSDFPTTPSAFDTSLNNPVGVMDAFIAKLTSDGSALSYSTYLGGSMGEGGKSILVDDAGSAYVAVNTYSMDFPITPDAFDTTFNGVGFYDVVIAKLDVNGSGGLVFSTFLGGGGYDTPDTLALDSERNVYVAGSTDSVDFPTTPDAMDLTLDGTGDAFLAKLNETGGALLYSTYIGGGDTEGAASMALASDGSLYLTGLTTSTDFPVTPSAFDTSYAGGSDAFVMGILLLPDLVIMSSDLLITPANPPTGLLADFAVNITNVGESGADVFITTDFVDIDLDMQIDPGEPIDNLTAGPLLATNRTTVTFLWTPDTPGMHRLCAWADSPDDILEESEGNNVACIDVLVVQGPETRPDYVPWQPQPPGLVRTGLTLPVPLSVIVRNVGNRTARNESTLAFYNETPPSPPFVMHAVPRLLPNATSTRFGATWISPAVPGIYFVSADMDYYDNLTEWNESDNVYTWTIEVVEGPVTSLIVGSPNYTSTFVYVNSSTPLDLSVVDRGGTGIRYTNYSMDGGPWVNYTAMGTFNLSGEGEHTIEWYSEDFAGNVEVTQNATLRVDDTPPTTNVAIGDPKYVAVDTFVTSSTLFTLTATDGGLMPVGLDNIEYRIDGGSWTPYTTSFTLSAGDGPRTLSYRARDLLGNEENESILTVIVDDTPPSTNANVGDPKVVAIDTFVTSSTPISLTATDGGLFPVGLSSIEYQIDGGSPLTYIAPFALQGEGLHTISYRSVDLLGNWEAANPLTVIVDDTPPTTSHEIRTPVHVAADTYVTSNTDITLTSIDGGLTPVGLDVVEYQVDGGGWLAYSSGFTLTGADGPRTIEYRSSDLLGNGEAVKNFTVILDDTPPATTFEPATGPYSLDTVFTLTAADGGSGVNVTRYRIDGGAWTTYSGSFTLTEGTHNVSFYSIDMLDNTEAERWREVTISGEPPLEVETNYKPLVAVIFAIILLIAGLWSSRRRPWKGGEDWTAVAKAFIVFSLPFVLAEVATGIVSALTGALSIPPILGAGTVTDIAILVAGLAVAILRGLSKKDYAKTGD